MRDRWAPEQAWVTALVPETVGAVPQDLWVVFAAQEVGVRVFLALVVPGEMAAAVREQIPFSTPGA
jgi:hypothetical protein